MAFTRRGVPYRFTIRSIRWRLTAGGLITVGLPLVVLAAVMGSMLWRFHLRQVETELETQVRVIADAVAPALVSAERGPSSSAAALRDVVEGWRRHTNSRVAIIDTAAVVRAATTGEGVGAAVDEARRPGMRAALGGRGNVTVWRSPNFDYEETMYINAPARYEGRVVGAVRVAHSLGEIQERVTRVRATLLAVVLVYGAVLVALIIAFAGGIVRPVENLRREALRIAAGDLAHRVHEGGPEEIAQLAATLNQMTARLQVLEGLRRQYVSDVSHELRTPLAAIRSMAETLLQYGDSDPGLRERYLPRILAQSDRLARLATQLLDLAQIESGNLVSAFASVSLDGVLEEVRQAQAERAVAMGVELSIAVPHELPPVAGDHDRLVQVFLNLVDNALRYTPAGGRVTLSARAEPGRVQATVEDTGEGIAPEHLSHLFERFYRVEKARSARSGGAGLGLAIVRQIVEAHGGTIDVASAPGAGTRFRVELPRSRPDARTSRPPSPVVTEPRA